MVNCGGGGVGCAGVGVERGYVLSAGFSGGMFMVGTSLATSTWGSFSSKLRMIWSGFASISAYYFL